MRKLSLLRVPRSLDKRHMPAVIERAQKTVRSVAGIKYLKTAIAAKNINAAPSVPSINFANLLFMLVILDIMC